MTVLDIFTHTCVEIPFSCRMKDTHTKLYGVLLSVSLTKAFLLFDIGELFRKSKKSLKKGEREPEIVKPRCSKHLSS